MNRARSLLLSVLLTTALTAGLAAAVPATPASAACGFGATAYDPYKSGSNRIRTKIHVVVSCKGHLRIDHWVTRNGSSVRAWQNFYTAPFNSVIDRVAETCRAGGYRVYLGVYFVGSNGESWLANRQAGPGFFNCG